MKKIALFGGSFDPVHYDHIQIAKICHYKLKYDEVWLIPTYINVFKEKMNCEIQHKLNMLKIATEKLKFIRIELFEINKKRPVPTFETINYLKNKYKNINFSFIMGSDQLDRLEEWENFDIMKNQIDFVIFNRKNNNTNFNVLKKNNLKFINFKSYGFSSTEIRNLTKVDNKLKKVKEYINNNLLYIDERVKPFLSQKRFDHCIRVAEMSQKLTRIYCPKLIKKAYISGFLHDITKEWDLEKQVSYLKKYNKKLLQEPKQIYHSFTGYYHLKNDWKFTDKKIINAVFKHTVGWKRMSILDKIIFCADKIEINRNYPNVEYFRKICFENLDNGFIQLLYNQFHIAKEKHGINNIGKILLKNIKYYNKKGKKYEITNFSNDKRSRKNNF